MGDKSKIEWTDDTWSTQPDEMLDVLRITAGGGRVFSN